MYYNTPWSEKNNSLSEYKNMMVAFPQQILIKMEKGSEFSLNRFNLPHLK